MSEPVYVDKAKVIADLRARQLHARADWVDRELPGQAHAVLTHSRGMTCLKAPATCAAVMP
jgi:hypothetical protein